MILGVIIGSYGNEILIRIIFTFKSFFSSFLLFFLPLMVLICVTHSIISMDDNVKNIAILAILLSFILTLIIGQITAILNYFVLLDIIDFKSLSNSLLSSMKGKDEIYSSYINFGNIFKPILTIMSALFLSILIGFTIAFSNDKKDIMNEIYDVNMSISRNFLISLLPFFIMGIFCELTVRGLIKLLIIWII